MGGTWGRAPIVIILLATALLASAIAAGASETGTASPAPRTQTVGREISVSGPGAIADDTEAAVAYNSKANEYLVVWMDGRNQGSRGSDIYGRRLSASGARLGSDFRICGSGADGEDRSPAVAYNPAANQYLVVWSDARSGASRGQDIYGQRISATGTAVGGELRISGPAAIKNEAYPAVAYNSTSNQYLVVWEDWRSQASRGFDIYGRRLTAAGAFVGADFRISGAAAVANDMVPAVAYNRTSNEYLVVWMDGRNSSTRGIDLYGQRLSAAGATVGGEFRVSSAAATANEYKPELAHNPAANQYLVVWADERNNATRLWDVYAKRLSATGAAIGADVRVSGPRGTSYDVQPVAAYNPTASQYLVAWADKRSFATRGYDIYARRLSASGGLIGGDFRVAGAGGIADEELPAIAHNPSANQYLVVWQDARKLATRGLDIYGRRIAG
ncbi:MAG TPA: hypothetical protein VLS92_09725 [Acidimicrobiia bacterium]|nr:hypothetical protein [Acidimicrobiia bacterium]